MSLAKLTIIGQETWLQKDNKSLFDLFTLPEAIDKDTCIDNIILECGDFEVLYSDPYFMRSAIGVWSKKHYRTFEKWAAALAIDYNPLENYDRVEEWTDTENEKSDVDFGDKTKTTTDSTTDTSGKSEQNGNTEDLVSAFDSDSYQESEKHVIDTDEKHEDNVKSNTVLDNETTQNTKGNKDTEGKHQGRIHGNIGVTTSQQMLQSEIDIARFNLVQQITDLFAEELCILVYE